MAKLRILLGALENTLFIGKELMHLDSVDSTNNYVKNLLTAEKRPNEGLLVFADDQFAGKGQLGNSWISKPGENIIASVLLYPVFLEPHQIYFLNKAVALAVQETITEIIMEKNALIGTVKIKWPNDIFIGEKKVAGILIENSLKTSRIENCVVGIGLNVNQIFAHQSTLNAVSIKEIIGEDVDLNKVLNILCTRLEKYYLMLRAFNFQQIDKQYHSCLFGVGEVRNFIVNDAPIKGIIKGVGENGLIHVEIDSINKEFDLKEIEFIYK